MDMSIFFWGFAVADVIAVAIVVLAIRAMQEDEDEL